MIGGPRLDDEIIRLLKTAENGPDREGVCGKDCAMLYRVALGTGLAAAN